MFKKGFTLAEVLIALAIIGVIAAITLPTFIANAYKQANASKLASTKSDIENAFSNMIGTEVIDDLTESKFFTDGLSTDVLKKYLKLSDNSDETLEPTYEEGYKLFLLKNNAAVGIESAINEEDETIGNLYIDVNNGGKPNKLDKDIFLFTISIDGKLFPKEAE